MNNYQVTLNKDFFDVYISFHVLLSNNKTFCLITANTLRIRWKTLRDSYIRERQRKLKEEEKDESERSHYTWKYYHQLEFLNSQLRE